MDTLRKLLEYARPFRKYWPKYLIFTILGLIFGIANYSLAGPLLDFIFKMKDASDFSILEIPDFSPTLDYVKSVFYFYFYKVYQASGIMWSLVFIAGLLIFASLISNVFNYASQRVLVTMRTDVMRNIRKVMYRKITSMDIGFFHNKQKGDLLSTVSNDVTVVQDSVISAFQVVLREPLLIIAYILVLFYYSYQLTLFTLVALPVSGFLIGEVIKKLRREAADAQSILGRIIASFEEGISGIRIIKGFNAHKQVYDRFDKLNQDHRNAMQKMMNRQILATPMSEFLGISIVALIVLYAGYLSVQDETPLSAGSFLIYFAFYYQLLTAAKSIVKEIANIQRGLASAQRIFDIIDMNPAITNDENPVPLKKFTTSIEFKHVYFSYGNEPIINDFNLLIPKGKTYALVGHSGAGKTTLADLIPRFYDVNAGEILIDGVNIKKYDLDDLMKQMGIVTQEAILFNDTVAGNIAFGYPEATEEQIIEAAKIANAHEFIIHMEEGYQTNIGDRGSNLSGGQRQRLSIARAVLKNPPILILDEATSALDTESERLVQDALNHLMKNRTSIVIAHRLSTIQHADSIIVIQNGTIAEMGNHEELLKKKGVYKKLCDLQGFE
ncbi:MAG: ABC transporter ATP-binding protein [Bacteroidales bacterium]|nr:ABC transporter ATP-binding protein [Bacteroidales bacterium]